MLCEVRGDRQVNPMTIVELFDEKPINNIVGALCFHPDKVIYVGGDNEAQFFSLRLPVLRNYYREKGIDPLEIEYVQVRRDSLRDIVEKLEQIYETNDDCHFHVEVTGGEDLILIGLGILCQRHPETELCQISGRLRCVRSYSVLRDTEDKLDITCANTVRENLLLHGASVVSCNGSDHLPEGYQWDFAFFSYFISMWEICCCGVSSYASDSPPADWNYVTKSLGELCAGEISHEDPNVIRFSKSYFNDLFLPDHDAPRFLAYLYAFISEDLLEYIPGADGSDEDIIIFKSDMVRLCLTVGGLMLELKIYMLCQQLFKERGGDCLTSVTIDWDGDDDLGIGTKYCYDPEDPSSVIDTINEVDVMATCGLMPYFISCKNGFFDSEELYKLYSVGERFGKGYCKKVLITTDMQHAVGNSRGPLLQRAADMGIELIEAVHTMTDDEILNALLKVLDLPKKKVTAG